MSRNSAVPNSFQIDIPAMMITVTMTGLISGRMIFQDICIGVQPSTAAPGARVNLSPREAAALRVRRMESCDLMILDDLGTEMITPMSLSALYTLVNTRLVNGRKMIISTNCSEYELAKKYTPQICSRIAGEFIALPFVGQDIRKLKRGI